MWILISQRCLLSVAVTIGQSTLSLHSERDCRELLGGQITWLITVGRLKWNCWTCRSVLSCPRASPSLLLLPRPVQAGNLTAFFRIWGWRIDWVPNGRAVPLVLGTVAGWHSSTVACSGMPYRASKLSGCATKRRVGCEGRERRNQS